MSERERQEMFLDLYGNSMIRDKTSAYLDQITKELIQLVTEDSRCKSVLTSLVNLDNLRFKDRDDMEEILLTYYKKVPFDMEKLRDQRLRHHFAERYDFRRNAVDWDYQFSIKEKVRNSNKLFSILDPTLQRQRIQRLEDAWYRLWD